MHIHDRTERAISEVIAASLILILVISLAVVAGAYIFAIIKPVDRTGYLVPKAELFNLSGAEVIRLQHNAGDGFLLNATPDSSDGRHTLGIAVDSGTTSYRVGLAPSITRETFTPGSRIFIYRSGTGYLATDNPAAVPATGSVPSGALALVLTDETAHSLIARITLGTGNVTETATPTPTPTTTLVPVSTVYLNAAKGGGLQSGGTYQFVVTGSWSSINLGGTTYSLNAGDTVKLVTGSDAYGTLYGTSSTINTFSFDDVTLYINGVSRGTGTVNSIWISGYGSQTSTLVLSVPAASAWTNLRVDGTTLILGTDSRKITISGIKAPMNMATTATTVYYDGAASGYSLA